MVGCHWDSKEEDPSMHLSLVYVVVGVWGMLSVSYNYPSLVYSPRTTELETYL